MDTYLQQYRSSNPDDTRDDISILFEADSNGQLAQFPREKSLVDKELGEVPKLGNDFAGGSPDSASTSFLKSAAAGLVPTAGAWVGAEGGAAVGAEVGAVGGPAGILAGGLLGGFIGAVGGTVAASKAQKSAIHKIAPEIEEQLASNEAAHPIASTLGSIASALPMFELNPGQTVKGVSALWKAAHGIALDQAGKDAAMALAVQSGMGAGGAVVTPLVEGETPTMKDVGISTLTALILGKPRGDLGKMFKTLGLPKPPATQPADQVPAATAATAVPPGQSIPKPEDVYAGEPLPPERSQQLRDLAQRKVTDPSSLTGADWHTIGSLTDNTAPDFHPAASGEFMKAEAEAQVSKREATATEAVKAHLPIGLAGVENQVAIPPVQTEPSQPRQVATEIAAARKDVDTAPTDAQKEAGNYSKGHVTIDGMEVTIENPIGSKREGKDASGKPWSVTMPVDYGYIKGTKGADGDHVDVNLGPNPDSAPNVYVIDQRNLQTGKFDEHKSFLGFNDKESALEAYRKSFSDGKADTRIAGVTEMTRAQFKEWVESGDHTKRLSKPEAVPDAVRLTQLETMEEHGLLNPTTKAELKALRAAGNKPETKPVAAAAKPVATTPAPEIKPEIKVDWTKLQGSPESVVKLVTESTAPIVEKGGEATKGKKVAQLYREIKTTADPQSPEVQDALFKTSRAEGDSRLASQKRVVMLAPDATHVVVGTPGEVQRTNAAGKKSWVRSIASYDSAGAIKNRPYEDLLNEGWKPIAAIKTDVTASSKAETYSFQEWVSMRQRILEHVQSKLAETESGVEEVSTKDALAHGIVTETSGAVKSTPNAPLFGSDVVVAANGTKRTADLHRPTVGKLVKLIGEKLNSDPVKRDDQIMEAFGKLDPEESMRLLDALSPKDQFSEDKDYQAGYHRLSERIFEAYENKTGPIPAEALADEIAGVSGDAEPVVAAAKGATDVAGVVPKDGTPAAVEPAKETGGPGKSVPAAAESTGNALADKWLTGLERIIKDIPANKQRKALAEYIEGLRSIYAHSLSENERDAYKLFFEKISAPTVTRNRELDSSATLKPNEKYVPESLPREGERALGSPHLVAAADVARGAHLAGAEAGDRQPTRGQERIRLNRRLKPEEEAALEKFASDNSLWLDSEAFGKAWFDDGTGGGAEHRVIIGDGKSPVLKANDGSLHGTWLDFIHRIGLHNSLFPETKLTFKGFVHGGAGLEIVFEQPYVKALRGATADEIKAFMAKRGFERRQYVVSGTDRIDARIDEYYNPKTGVIVKDLRAQNALVIEVPEGAGAIKDGFATAAGAERWAADRHMKDVTITRGGNGFAVYARAKDNIAIIDPLIELAKPEDFNKGVENPADDLGISEQEAERLLGHPTDDAPGRGQLHAYEPPKERNYAAEDKATIESLRPSEAYVAQTIRQIVHALTGQGIDVRLMQESFAGMVKDCAKYEEWKNDKKGTSRAITVSLADVNKPTVETLKSLLHEAAHAVFARETPEMQAILHDAIEQASNDTLGIGNFTEKVTGRFLTAEDRARIAQEGRLAESAAQQLVASGFAPDKAQGIIQRVMMAVQQLYQRAAMAIMQAMGLPVSPERAMDYFQTRMKLALTGGKADSVVSFFGGPRMKMDANGWNHPDSMVIVRNKDIRGTSDPLDTSVSKDLTNPTKEKEPGVAAEGVVHNVLAAAVKAYNEEGHNEAGIAPEALIGRFGLPDSYPPGTLPLDKVNAANEALLKAGFKAVDPATSIATITNEALQKQAAAISIRQLNEVSGHWRAKRRAADLENRRSARELSGISEPLNVAIEKYTDLDMMAGQASLHMQDVIAEHKEYAKQIPELAGKQSELDQVLRQLDSDIKGNVLSKPYADALEKLYKRLADPGHKANLGNMLQRVAELDLNWKEGKASELREQIGMVSDPLLKPLQENTHEGKALLAVAITFGKKNQYLMNLLTARKSSALLERAEVNKALQVAMSKSVSADAEARAMVARLTKLKGLANRLLDNIKDMKERQHELIDEIARNDKFIQFHRLADPIITQTLRPLEARIGAIKVNVMIKPETEVRVPQLATSRPHQFLAKTLYLKAGENGQITTTPEVRDALQKMSAWLEANLKQRESLGADFNEIESTYEKLSNYLTFYGAAEPIKQLWIAKWLAPTAEKLRLVNTPLSRAVAYMVENANTLYRKYRNDETKHSREWEVRRSEAMKALGIVNPDNFKREVADEFKDYLSKNRDLRATFADNAAANAAAIKAGMEHLMRDPSTRERFIKNPAAAKAVEAFFRKTIEVNAWRAATGKDMGNKVLDPRIGYYRDVIGSEAFEFPRGVSDQAEEMFLKMGAWAAPLKADKIAALHASGDGETLMAELGPRFSQPVWDGFVKWIAHKQGASAFAGPVKADGTYNYASRDNVIKAYENANSNPVVFAQDLFLLEGGHDSGADISAFVGDTMHTLTAQYHLLERMRGDYAENKENRMMPTPRRQIMDARLTDAAPREFYDYIDDDRGNLANLLRSQAYNSAFGRRMENYYQTIAAAEHEQALLVQQYDNIAAGIPGLKGRELRKAVLAEAKARELNVAALEQAHDNLRTIRTAEKEIQGFLSQNQGRPPELSVFATLMHGIGSLTVSGPGTAFTAHTIAFEQSIRKFGMNADGLRMLVETGKGTATAALRGAMQAFGRQSAIESEHLAGLERNGLGNPNTMMKWADQVKSVMTSPDYVHNVLGRGLIYTGRAMQLVATRLSAFHYLARVIQLGNSVAWAKKLTSVIEKGADHFADHPEDLANPAFKFTAKQLGVSEGRAFEYLQFAMSKYGLDLRHMVESGMKAKAKGQPLLTDQIYQRIAQVSLDDMTLESSPTTRPAFLTNNTLGQLSNPMLGWALHKSYDVVRSMRDADGRKSNNGFKTAMMAYAGILPLAMLAAYIRNKFDEDIGGRKIAVADLSTISNPHQAFTTLVDNASRVGTFGIFGELGNEFVNKENGARPTTLDGRVFFLNTLHAFVNGVENMAHQKDLDYQSVVRPLLTALGGNGFFQYAGIVNHTLALDNAEARTVNRISVNNFLRVAGRQNEMDVRTYSGMTQMASLPTPWRSDIGNMVMAAYANNAHDFNAARREAVARLLEQKDEKGKPANTREQAEKKVVQMYEDANPLRVVFKSLPTEQDYRTMLASMDDNGKVSVATALRLFKHYGEQIGGNGSLFAREPKATTMTSGTGTRGTGDSTIDAMLQRMRPSSGGFDLNEIRKRATMTY